MYRGFCVYTILTVVLWLVCLEGSAQRSLPDLLEQGIRNYPVVRARMAEVEGSVKDAAAARSAYVPKLTAQHQYTYATSNNLAGSLYPIGVISPSGSIRSENIDQPVWGSYTSALFEWNVVNFGKLSSTVRVAEKDRAVAEADLERELLEHRVRISDAYLLTLMYERLEAIQEVNVERAQVFFDIVNAGVLSGIRPGVDSSLASAELLRARLLLLQAAQERRTQEMRLREFIGIPASDELELDSMLFLSAIPTSLDTGNAHFRENPLLRYYKFRADATHARSIALKRSFLPSLTLVGAAWVRGSGISPVDDSYHASFRYGTKYRVNNYLLGVAARWTLSDYVSSRQRYKGEYYRALRDQELFSAQEIRLRRELAEAYMRYEVSIEQASTAPAQLTAAQDAYRQAMARYENGLADLLTLMQGMVALNRAEADLAVARINVWRSILAIAASKGDFSIFMNAVR